MKEKQNNLATNNCKVIKSDFSPINFSPTILALKIGSVVFSISNKKCLHDNVFHTKRFYWILS